jgi:hypothetical protein
MERVEGELKRKYAGRAGLKQRIPDVETTESGLNSRGEILPGGWLDFPLLSPLMPYPSPLSPEKSSFQINEEGCPYPNRMRLLIPRIWDIGRKPSRLIFGTIFWILDYRFSLQVFRDDPPS